MGTIRIERHTTVVGDFDNDGVADDQMTITTYVDVDTGDDEVADDDELAAALRNEQGLQRQIAIDLNRDGSVDRTTTTRAMFNAATADSFEGVSDVSAEARRAWAVAINESDLMLMSANGQDPSLGEEPTDVLGTGYFSVYGSSPTSQLYFDNAIVPLTQTMQAAWDDAGLLSADSPIPADVRAELRTEYQHVLDDLNNAYSTETLQAAIERYAALMARIDQDMQRYAGRPLDLGYRDAWVQPESLRLLGLGAGMAPNIAQVSPAYQELLDSTIRDILSTMPAGTADPAQYVIDHFPADVVEQLDEIRDRDVLGEIFTVTLDPPGDVSFQMVAFQAYRINDYIANSFFGDEFVGAGLGADVNHAYAAEHMGFDPPYDVTVDQATPPISWDADEQTLTDADGRRVRPVLIFSTP
jgi:hypothetical protein